MTEPALGRPLRFETVDEALDAVRDAGHRVTAPRRLVLAALFEAEVPVPAEDIATGKLGPIPADLASTYRNLELFERLGIVRHLHAGHGPGLYALAGEGEREYLVCENCGKVRAAAREELGDVHRVIREQFGFEARFGHFPLVGLCSDCAALRPRD